MSEVEQLTGPICHHGEGPIWSPAWGGLRWVDLTAGDVLAFDDDGGVRTWHVGPVAAAIRPRANGGLLLALERGFALADEFGGPLDDLGELWPETDVRLNDGGCDPQGGFLCGSMGTDYAPGRGTLYRLAPDRTITPVLPGLGVPNGLDWTPDGGTAYFVDSLAGTVEVFAHDPERGLHDRRPFVHVPSDEGLPDGLTVDAEGYVWIAIWGGGQVRRYAPDGRLDEVLEFPVRRVTACTFGGPGLDELYVTSVGDHALEHEGDVAGALFRVRVGVTGQPVRPFAG